MMPLKLAGIGEELTIIRIVGLPAVKAHLADLGFVVGANITVISSVDGNLIVNVKGSRIALGEDMAMKIFV
ncbi:FeoA family protein [uncultured Eubacterium sp.]|uniref:FeoA family protein n=1 Tax=uncultured Eubacterium sp. TaxID=165185 RepID=UPI0025E6165D|nr:FeoA family protein [uncultured Eubacterium sp.]